MPSTPQDPLKKYLKLGYPKTGVSGGSFTVELSYVGDHNSLAVGAPEVGAAWGAYAGTVVDVNLEPIGGTDPLMGELSVNLGKDYEAPNGGGDTGQADGITYEVDWIVVNRPLIEHPTFKSGLYELNSTDYQEIATWEADKTQENYDAMTEDGKKYADGILQGITTYDDFAPVLSLTTAYVNGPPPTSSAGAKDEPPTGFPNKPTGYEWVKSADRSLKAGKKNRWERIEQWTGGKKVLVDKNEIYY